VNNDRKQPTLDKESFMNKETFGTIEMLGKVAGFRKLYESLIPKGSLARVAFDIIDAALVAIATAGALPKRNGSRPGTEGRDVARLALRDDLDAIYKTMQAVALDHPGIEPNFRLPKNRRLDQQMIRAGQEFIKYATPLKDEFIAHQLPANFLDGLRSEIEALQQAINAQAQYKSDRRAAVDTLVQAVDNAMIAVQRLDAIIPNIFGDDHEVMTAWDVARQVNKPKHRKKADKTDGKPATPTPLSTEAPSVPLPHPPIASDHPSALPPA
jgi:hypothetical protein